VGGAPHRRTEWRCMMTAPSVARDSLLNAFILAVLWEYYFMVVRKLKLVCVKNRGDPDNE